MFWFRLFYCILGFTGFTLPPEFQATKPLVPALQSNWLFMHVSVMMLSYAGLFVGSLLSIAYVVIYITTNDKAVLNQQKGPASLPANSPPSARRQHRLFCSQISSIKWHWIKTEFAFSVNTSFPGKDLGGVSNLKNLRIIIY